jgi:hypothetical protein
MAAVDDRKGLQRVLILPAGAELRWSDLVGHVCYP